MLLNEIKADRDTFNHQVNDAINDVMAEPYRQAGLSDELVQQYVRARKTWDRDRRTQQLRTAVWLQKHMGETNPMLVKTLMDYNGRWTLPWSVFRLRTFYRFSYPHALPIAPNEMRRELEKRFGRGNVKVRTTRIPGPDDRRGITKIDVRPSTQQFVVQ